MATNIPDFVYIWNSSSIKPSITWTPKLAVLDGPSPPVGAVGKQTEKEAKPAEGNWYITSLILVGTVLFFISLVVGLVVRRVLRYRRRMSARINSSSTVDHLNRCDRPASGSYDTIPYATPNIYDGTEDPDVNGDEKKTIDTPPCHSHAVLNRCYSALEEVTDAPASTYETLTRRQNQLNESNNNSTNENKPQDNAPEMNIIIETYTIPFKGNGQPKKHDYLALEVEGDENSSSSSHTYLDPIVKPAMKASDDYLIPFS